jgi:hypothetical protein
MQKWTAFLFAALVAGFVAVLVIKVRPPPGPAGGSDAGADGAVASAADAGQPMMDADVPAEEPVATLSDAGSTLPNGERAPGLAAEAPKSVKFGAILVQYHGAQSAGPSTRSKDAATELAKQLAAEAKQDFKAAVAKGDKGSGDDLGGIPRGVLEPAPEYVLFNLPKGGVSDPVDTPRGFLILRRIE